MLVALFLITLAAVPPEVEVARVRAHLIGAEQMMDARDVSALSPEQRASRRRARERLRAYRARGEFPGNPGTVRVPIFIDGHGTRCAMAHLIEASGAGAYVLEVARSRNNARVVELADDPRLVAWLDANGLTLQEAARIQPTYDGRCNRPSCICGGSSGNIIFPVPTTGLIIEPSTTSTRAVVIAVAGERASEFPVGGDFSYRAADSPGRVFIGLSGPDEGFSTSRRLDADGKVVCGDVSVTALEAVDAVASGMCARYLIAKDPLWGDDCTGCQTIGGSGGELTALIIVAFALVRSRRR